MDYKLVEPFKGKCEGGRGPDLARYPNLVHTPEKGVFTHLAGVPVQQIADLATAAVSDPNGISLVDLVNATAKNTGATWDEILDALRYARASGLL